MTVKVETIQGRNKRIGRRKVAEAMRLRHLFGFPFCMSLSEATDNEYPDTRKKMETIAGPETKRQMKGN